MKKVNVKVINQQEFDKFKTACASIELQSWNYQKSSCGFSWKGTSIKDRDGNLKKDEKGHAIREYQPNGLNIRVVSKNWFSDPEMLSDHKEIVNAMKVGDDKEECVELTPTAIQQIVDHARSMGIEIK